MSRLLLGVANRIRLSNFFAKLRFAKNEPPNKQRLQHESSRNGFQQADNPWLILFALKSLIVIGMLYGIRTSIEDGEVTNEPELLRNLMFFPFSMALCFLFCRLIGLAKNDWPNRFMMLGIAYIPIGLFLGNIAGMF